MSNKVEFKFFILHKNDSYLNKNTALVGFYTFWKRFFVFWLKKWKIFGTNV